MDQRDFLRVSQMNHVRTNSTGQKVKKPFFSSKKSPLQAQISAVQIGGNVLDLTCFATEGFDAEQCGLFLI